MPPSQSITMLVLVKAAPVMTADLEETMCVAGALVGDDGPGWVRLHPVPFRDLADTSKFVKYQTVQAEVIRHRTDRRPETWTPLSGTIVTGQTIGTEQRWAARRPLIAALGTSAMCELVERNRQGSGPTVPSLAVVRPAEPPKLVIVERDPLQLKKWQFRGDAAAARPSLFDSPSTNKAPFEVVPWRFSCRYRCESRTCAGHTQTIVDWEVVALWRHVMKRPDWRDAMVDKFERELWQGRDSLLFVGNQEQYPTSFLVLGVFWPPDGPVQGALEL